jgi:hypothetical protein
VKSDGGQAAIRTDWDGLRIVIEERPEHLQVSSTIPANAKCSAAERVSLHAAKFAAVDFVATARFGPSHDLKPEIVAAMLVWENG